MVILPKAEYDELVAAVEDLEDLLVVQRSRARIAAGQDELITDAEMDDYLDAPTPIAFWRKKRGSTLAGLADRAGVTEGYLTAVENGDEQPSVPALKALAEALNVTMDELVA